MASPEISIIIPVLNEAAIVRETLLRLEANLDIEVIVVDGGSTDKTVELVKELGIKVILSPLPGRARQMNAGAAEATGKILLFLHADTRLPENYPAMVRAALSQPDTIAGAFELKIEGKEQSLRWIERSVNWRSRFFSMPYGDQAIFLRASVFERLGGFPILPIMEDFELILRLKRQGKISIVPASVTTSGRRWQKLGVLKTTLINQLVIIGYFFRISPDTLARWYRSF